MLLGVGWLGLKVDMSIFAFSVSFISRVFLKNVPVGGWKNVFWKAWKSCSVFASYVIVLRYRGVYRFRVLLLLLMRLLDSAASPRLLRPIPQPSSCHDHDSHLGEQTDAKVIAVAVVLRKHGTNGDLAARQNPESSRRVFEDNYDRMIVDSSVPGACGLLLKTMRLQDNEAVEGYLSSIGTRCQAFYFPKQKNPEDCATYNILDEAESQLLTIAWSSCKRTRQGGMKVPEQQTYANNCEKSSGHKSSRRISFRAKAGRLRTVSHRRATAFTSSLRAGELARTVAERIQ